MKLFIIAISLLSALSASAQPKTAWAFCLNDQAYSDAAFEQRNYQGDSICLLPDSWDMTFPEASAAHCTNQAERVCSPEMVPAGAWFASAGVLILGSMRCQCPEQNRAESSL